jgi:hypothetical protein
MISGTPQGSSPAQSSAADFLGGIFATGEAKRRDYVVFLGLVAVLALLAVALLTKPLWTPDSSRVETWANAVADGDCKAAQSVVADLNCDSVSTYNAWVDVRSLGLNFDHVEEGLDGYFTAYFTDLSGHLVTLGVDVKDRKVITSLPTADDIRKD